MYTCLFCSFNPDAFLEISPRIMDLAANKGLCKVNIILNSRINPIHMEKAHLFRHSPWSVLEFRFVNDKFQQADAKVSSVTRKENNNHLNYCLKEILGPRVSILEVKELLQRSTRK